MKKVYNTEIISVGTELLLGHVANTDARDVSELLSTLGINVLYHSVVGDNPARLKKCLQIARERADIIITTGGLGPTCDDLTKQTICEEFDIPLVFNQTEFDSLYEYITARHTYTENNTQQAMLPLGCTVFHNSCGTAPGCAFTKNDTTVIMLPGPPRECAAMMKESVVPFLASFSDDVIVSHTVNIFGLSESGVDSMFADEMNSMINPTMAPYAKEADCLLKITAKASDRESAETLCNPVIEHVVGRLGDVVYGIDAECLEAAAASLITESQKSVSIAEGFTGGEISSRLSAALVRKDLFKTGYVMPSAGCSDEFVSAFADNIRLSSGADIAVAVGGEEHGSFSIALATGNETFIKKIELGEFRPLSFIRRMAGNHAFDMIRRYLTGKNVI